VSATLDPQAQRLLDAAKAAGLAPPYELPPPEARERMRAAFIAPGEPLPVHRVEDAVVPGPAGGIPLRVFHPGEQAGGPVVVFLHGGGWVVNDLDTHDHLCRRLARGSGATVVAVDYRRSPEWRYPAALEDCYAAWRWLLDNAEALGVDAARTAVVGDSSGGTLATALALLCRDRGAPAPAVQVLAYPVTRLYDETDSYEECAVGYSLNRDFMRWFIDHHVDQRTDLGDPYLFPSHAPRLGGLPRALVLTAQFDPLRDEGAAYARLLADAGVRVEHWHLDDQMHGFLMQDRAIDRADQTIDELGVWLAAALAG
jgi:acetyl esterase/lipase